MVRYAVGCMTGTSLDGLDAVLVEAEGVGLDLRVRTLARTGVELGALAFGLGAATSGTPMSAGDFSRLALELGELHAQVVGELVDRSGLEPAVCALPGQTVVHAPPISMQLINPWPVAQRLGCPVIHDLRGADLAAGGQGAPITPLADWVLFRSEEADRAIVNLGGFCNVTSLPAGLDTQGVQGFDVCVCNQVLDSCARAALGMPYDHEGRAALAGTPDCDAVDALRDVLRGQSTAGRSLGSGFAVLAGGGVRNAALVRAIEDVVGPCQTTEAFGIGVQEREAVCVAVLGLLALDGVVYTQASITGRTRPLMAEGSWIGGRP